MDSCCKIRSVVTSVHAAEGDRATVFTRCTVCDHEVIFQNCILRAILPAPEAAFETVEEPLFLKIEGL